ncbi:thioredoxin-like protein AAED1, chloroplastic isoform X2 [Corylus avellana]|uniref:thioredoxin-like protein AAED1, chloroplastic isoform X2 n=1 Tax=Corylus avellana TaxID=13451 RepID=UPI00286BD788|nr:thioredoxin-like protein AAED1, chloroplastic isoform X2 [Corylus avellana]
MATSSLSTTLSTNNIRSNRITNPCSKRVLPIRTLNLSRSPKHSKKTANLRQSHVIVPSAVSGSSGIETSVVSEDTTSLLDTVNVFDLNGNAIPISDLWKDRKAVVAFARHFGCVLCRKRADYLASKQARAFTEQTKFKGEVYADPTHSSYEALRFVYGVSTTFTPKAGLKIIQSYMEGYRQDWKLSFERDTVNRGGWQQGGVIVAGPGKSNISYVHKDKEAGDDPDIEDILKACCS